MIYKLHDNVYNKKDGTGHQCICADERTAVFGKLEFTEDGDVYISYNDLFALNNNENFEIYKKVNNIDELIDLVQRKSVIREVTVKIKIDTSELDLALEKIKKLGDSLPISENEKLKDCVIEYKFDMISCEVPQINLGNNIIDNARVSK